MVRVLGIVDDRLTCIDPERDLHREWKRAATPFLTPAEHLAQIKQKDPAIASTKSVQTALRTSREEEKGTAQLRGSQNYVEPRIDYCSRAPRFKPVRDGLVTHPSWKRHDFSALLRMWCTHSPRDRHSRAAYAFNLDGTPTFEYEKALTIYAEQRMDVVAGCSRGYAFKAGGETGRDVLRLTTGPMRSRGIQKQQSSSQIQEDEDEEADEEKNEEENEEDNEEDNDEENEATDEDAVEEDDEPGPWQEQLENRAKFNELWKRTREGVQRGRGPSPDLQRPVAEVKRIKHKGKG
ncbi:hypothetical protein KCU61_g8155, partial [Aureobasidium melanogenum]